MKVKKVLAVFLAIGTLGMFFVRGTAGEKYNNEWILSSAKHAQQYSYQFTTTGNSCSGDSAISTAWYYKEYFMNTNEARAYFQMVKVLYDKNVHKYYSPSAKTLRALLDLGNNVMAVFDVAGAAGIINISSKVINVGITIAENLLPELFEQFISCSNKDEVEELFMKLRDCTNGGDSFSAKSLNTGLKVTCEIAVLQSGQKQRNYYVEKYDWPTGTAKKLVATSNTHGTWKQFINSDFKV